MPESRTFILRERAHAESLIAYLKEHAGPAAAAGKPLAVTVSTYRQQRTPKQNGMLHKLIEAIEEQVVIDGRRFDLETWKEQIRRKFIGTEEYVMPDGTRAERGMSTTGLNVAEFSKLIDDVRAWAINELNVHLDDF